MGTSQLPDHMSAVRIIMSNVIGKTLRHGLLSEVGTFQSLRCWSSHYTRARFDIFVIPSFLTRLSPSIAPRRGEPDQYLGRQL